MTSKTLTKGDLIVADRVLFPNPISGFQSGESARQFQKDAIVAKGNGLIEWDVDHYTPTQVYIELADKLEM